MILVSTTGDKITAISTISSDEKAAAFLAKNPHFVQAPADFDPHLPLASYEYVGGAVKLKSDWATIEAEHNERRSSRYNTKPRAFRSQTEAVKAKANERIEAGAPYNGTRWPADAESQLAKSSMAASIGAGRGLAKGRTTVTVREMDRTKHSMTQSEYLDLAEAIRDYVVDIRETADNHIDALMALLNDDTKTAGDVQTYDVTTGWPA